MVSRLPAAKMREALRAEIPCPLLAAPGKVGGSRPLASVEDSMEPRSYDTCTCGCQSWNFLENEDTGRKSWYCKRCGRQFRTIRVTTEDLATKIATGLNTGR